MAFTTNTNNPSIHHAFAYSFHLEARRQPNSKRETEIAGISTLIGNRTRPSQDLRIYQFGLHDDTL